MHIVLDLQTCGVGVIALVQIIGIELGVLLAPLNAFCLLSSFKNDKWELSVGTGQTGHGVPMASARGLFGSDAADVDTEMHGKVVFLLTSNQKSDTANKRSKQIKSM